MTFSLKIFVLASSLLLSTLSYSSDLPSGHIDFELLNQHYGDARVEINLSKNLIGLVGAAAKNNEPELGEILSKLEQVKVRIFDLNDDLKTALGVVDAVTKEIKKEAWENIVTVNEADEKIRIFSKTKDDKIAGIIVMIVSEGKAQGGEAVFINIVGEIDPANISKVTQSLHINMGK